MSRIDNLLRERCRKEQRLLTAGHAFNNPHDVGEETHVEHAVGLVQTEDLRFGQVDVASLAHVHDTAGCADDDVNALAEGFCLLFEVGATVNGQDGQTAIALEHDQFFCDLIGEFTCGCQNEGLEFARWLAAFKDGQAKGSGFS